MSDKRRVLFITYFFETKHGVGAQRLSYWAKNIARLSKNTISCDVITSKCDQHVQYEEIDNIYCVGDEGRPMFSLFIKDRGYPWQINIKEFLLKRENSGKYDWVILSGGPFMQFLLVPFLKKLFNCRMILDFRDPFANNPRFNDGALKALVKSYYEKKFLRGADQIITVNKYCAEIISRSNTNANISIIDNGFNEAAADAVSVQNAVLFEKINFIYSGTFYPDRSPANFLSVIAKAENTRHFSLVHVGNKSEYLRKYDGEVVKELGSKSYADTLNEIAKANVGIIFTGGTAFESTTKIFDYIGLNKSIAIITAGIVKTGALHDITADYPSVFWAENNEASIQNTLEEIRSSNLEVNYPDRESFSRKAGLMKLIDLM